MCDRTLADWTSVDIYSDRNIVHNVTRSAPFKIHRSGVYFVQSCRELFQNSFFLSAPFNKNWAFKWKPRTSRILQILSLSNPTPRFGLDFRPKYSKTFSVWEIQKIWISENNRMKLLLFLLSVLASSNYFTLGVLMAWPATALPSIRWDHRT